jgi:O-antigen ligase/tetratricopeptide (TPR) repeat protein
MLVAVLLYFYAWLGPLWSPFEWYAPLATLVLFAGWWAWKVARRERLAKSPLALPLVAVVAATAIATLYSTNPRLSVPGLLDTLALVLAFFVICDMLLAGWSAQTWVTSLLLLCAFLMFQGLRVAVSWHWAWWQVNVPEYPPFLVAYRLFGIGSHPNVVAAVVNLALPFAIIRLAEAERFPARMAYGLWLAAATVVLLFTQSRGGWVAASVEIAICVGWLLLRPGRPNRGGVGNWARMTWRIWAAAAVYLAAFAALFVASSLVAPSEYNTSGGSLSSAGGRTAFWSVAIRSFLADPLTGSGPLTYGGIYASQASAIWGFLAIHAHNLLLNKLAQEGLVGTLAAGWVLLAGAWTLGRAWRTSRSTGVPRHVDRPLLVAACAALVGFLIHGLVDVPLWQTRHALLLAIVAGVGLSAAGTLRPGTRGLSRWTVVVLIAPLVLAAVLLRQAAGTQALQQGIKLGSQGDWTSAAAALDSAAAADPGLSFYYAQRAYAYGVVAAPLQGAGTPEASWQALESYAAARRAGPEYVPDLVNTAEVLDRVGMTDQAEALLAEAVARASDWALPALLLAERHADRGEIAEAQHLFARAFASQPDVREMAGCRRHPACIEAARGIPTQASATEQRVGDARALIAQGHPQEGLDRLRAISIRSADPLPWLTRAEAHLALGQLSQARYALRAADELGGSRLTRSSLAYADWYLAKGRARDAIAELERAAGPSTLNGHYNAVVFRRGGFPGVLLPGLALLERTSDDAEVLRRLARLYALDGRAEEAERARERAHRLSALLAEGALHAD